MWFVSLNGFRKKVVNAKKYLVDWQGGSRSKFQKNVKDFLYPHWRSHIVFEEFPIIGTRMSLDFYDATTRTAIEVQGAQHSKYNPFMHGKSKTSFIDQLNRDGKKIDFCKKNRIKLVEIFPDDKLSVELLDRFVEDYE